MTEQNNFNVERMHVELFLPSDQVRGSVVIPQLSHGSTIVSIMSGEEDLIDCDALITKSPDFSLGIRTADCAPICFGDGETIGIAHVGWRGLCQGLIEQMWRHFHAETFSVYVGPFLHSFQIQRDFCYDQIVERFGEEYIEQRSDKIIFHFKDAISSLLPPQTVYDPRDTNTDISFPSHRRDKTRDRFTTVVSFSPI